MNELVRQLGYERYIVNYDYNYDFPRKNIVRIFLLNPAYMHIYDRTRILWGYDND